MADKVLRIFDPKRILVMNEVFDRVVQRFVKGPDGVLRCVSENAVCRPSAITHCFRFGLAPSNSVEFLSHKHYPSLLPNRHQKLRYSWAVDLEAVSRDSRIP